MPVMAWSIIRRPLPTAFGSEDSNGAVFNRAPANSSTDISGLAWRIKAAAPATCGAAILVPVAAV